MPYSIVMRTSLPTLALFASLALPFAACSEATTDPIHEPATAEKPFVPVNNPPTDLPPEQQKLLVPGAPAVTEPIDIVRDLGKLLEVRKILAEALPGEPLYGFTPDAGPMLDYNERLAR